MLISKVRKIRVHNQEAVGLQLNKCFGVQLVLFVFGKKYAGSNWRYLQRGVNTEQRLNGPLRFSGKRSLILFINSMQLLDFSRYLQVI